MPQEAKFHERNPAKHEYEVQKGSDDAGRYGMVFAGNREATAVRRAVEILGKFAAEDHLKLYHTYPSPGPQRRYVGRVTRDGKLHRAGGE
jgi:hypothetical protein